MAFQYQVEHWSTGQVAFKMPDRDLTPQDLAILSLPWYVLAAQVQTSPWVFDRLNKKKAFKGIYAPGLALENHMVSVSPPFNYNKKAEGIEILHKYMVELEGFQVKLKIDLSDYTDEKSREEALDFITTYAQALKMGLASPAPHLAVSIQAVGPNAPAQIAEYQQAKKAKMKPEVNSKNLEIVMALLMALTIVSLIGMFGFPLLGLAIPTLLPLLMPVTVGAGVAFGVSFFAAIISSEVINMRERDRRMEKEYEQICMNISPSTVLVPDVHAPTMDSSVFSNSSAAGLSVFVEPSVSAAPGEPAPGPDEAAPAPGEAAPSASPKVSK